MARRITGKLAVSRPSKRHSSGFRDEQDLQDARSPSPASSELTTGRFHRDESGAYLTLDRHPVLLPPKLALLIKEQIARPVSDSRIRQQFGNGSGYLFPGKAPGRPRNAAGTHHLLQQHGLAVLTARNTAMIEAVTSLPPIVVSRPLRHAPPHGPEMGELRQR
ncbi:hypothetical protein [Streptomyces swartbergensis]|uniref:hypothetical protein n=1 Tax=Streptomyces swartbergensis TaxID=487165 RepID=UPI0037F9A4BA